MEDDIDIYADLPSFNPEKNDQDCNCKELKKELNSFISKFESIQKIKMNLEKNLSSLLKTAKAEIARKDKMIAELRKQLDDVTFRRNNKNESLGFSTHKLSHQHTITRKYENVSPMHSQENETESHQIQFHHDEHKSKKPQNDINRISTVFGERLHKRIIKDEKDEKKQKMLLKLNVEAKTKDISKENIIENNKENGSQFSINNGNEFNIEQYSSSEPPYRKKRMNEEDDTHNDRHKRLKIENNEDKITTEETDYFTRYDLTDNPVQYCEMNDGLTKFEDRLDAAHFFKKEEVPSRHRAASEHQNTKRDQSCTNGWRNEAKSNSAKDYDGPNDKNSPADSSRNSRTASMSNYVSEGFNSYKKNGHRYSPPRRRSYSRSRSDYESSSSRLRERSSRTNREKKYDDYKYDNRYGRLKRSYEKERWEDEENDGKTRYRRRERSNLRDKSKYSSSDAEDKESSSSYKNKKYENRRIKKETANILNDKKLHENNKAAAETDFRESSSRTIINNSMNTGKSITEKSAEKNIEQDEMKNESEIKSTNATESTSVHVAMEDLNNLEEGEILDTPEKKNNSAKISKDNKMEENNIKIVPVEDKNKNVPVNASTNDKSIPYQNDVNSTKQLEVADISTKKIEVISLQENSKDCGEIIQLNSSKSDIAIDEVYNCIKDEDTCKKDDDTCKSHINEDLMDSTTHIIMIEQVHDNDIDGNDKNDFDKTSKDFITETVIKIKEITNSNIESVTDIKELDDLSIKSATKKEETDNPNVESVVKITEVNNFNNDNSIHKNDGDELRTSTVEAVMRVEAVLNCDIEDRDKSHVPIGNETFQMSNKNKVEVCLNDHNYVQNSSINVSALDTIQKPSLRSECDEAIPETSKGTKAEKTINVQPVGVKRTIPSVVKNKKDQKSKGILISHRRKAVILSDSNASMTILMNTNIAKTSCVNNSNDNDSTLKPRACKISRVSAKATCK